MNTTTRNRIRKLSRLVFASAILVPFFGMRQALATALTVQNFSFESTANTTGPQFGGTADHWVFISNEWQGVVAISGFTDNAGTSDQTNALLVNNTGASPTTTVTNDTSPGNILPNTVYTLTVALGNPRNADDTAFGVPADITLSLLANGLVIPAASTTITGTSIPNNTFTDYSVSFTSPLSGGVDGEALNVQLFTSQPDGLNRQSLFDNIRINATVPVPEPSSIILCGLGAMGLFVTARRRRI